MKASEAGLLVLLAKGLHDERKLAWDVTGKGHRGNGNIEVGLDESSDFNYVMGLVR